MLPASECNCSSGEWRCLALKYCRFDVVSVVSDFDVHSEISDDDVASWVFGPVENVFRPEEIN